MKWFRDAVDPDAEAEKKKAAERMAKAEKEHQQYNSDRNDKEKKAQDSWHQRMNDIPPFTAQGAYHQAREAAASSRGSSAGENAAEAKERMDMYNRAYEWKKREKERKKDRYTSWSRGGGKRVIDEEEEYADKSAVHDFESFKANVRANRLREADARAAKQSLGMSPNDTELTLAMVKKAFGARALATHPDTASESKKSASAHLQHSGSSARAHSTDEFIRVQKAYQLLTDILTDPPSAAANTAAR